MAFFGLALILAFFDIFEKYSDWFIGNKESENLGSKTAGGWNGKF